MDIEEFNKEDILGDFEYKLNKLCQSCIGTATEIKIKQQPLINLFEKIVWFYEKEKEKNKEAGVILGKRIKICNEFQLELEKEKEKNKNARYYIIDRLNNDDIMNIGIDDMKIILDMLEE